MKSVSHSHIRQAYPAIRPLFDAVGPVELPPPTSGPVAGDVVRIVIGQMLSGKAVDTIHRRVVEAACRRGVETWRLPSDVLLTCGLSARKVRSITEFRTEYDHNAPSIEIWRALSYNELCREVSQFWGLSDWTASMLAIFHFGHADVMPMKDGTIIRVIRMIEDRFLRGVGFDPSLSSPHGTAMAMTMWQSIDTGFWSAAK